MRRFRRVPDRFHFDEDIRVRPEMRHLGALIAGSVYDVANFLQWHLVCETNLDERTARKVNARIEALVNPDRDETGYKGRR